MIEFNKKKFIENYNLGKSQILEKELVADIETPISTFLKISKNEKYSFLLESVEGGDQRGRFTLLGCFPDLIWKVQNNKASIEPFNINFKIDEINQYLSSCSKAGINIVEIGFVFPAGNEYGPFAYSQKKLFSKLADLIKFLCIPKNHFLFLPKPTPARIVSGTSKEVFSKPKG